MRLIMVISAIDLHTTKPNRYVFFKKAIKARRLRFYINTETTCRWDDSNFDNM